MTPLAYVESAADPQVDHLGFRRLSFEEVEWLMERGFAVDRDVHGADIVSFSSAYLHEVLHPGTTWGFPDYKKAGFFMDKLRPLMEQP
jgi:hypothetical protein